MRLKRLQTEESPKAVRPTKQLAIVVTTNYKPIDNHQYNIDYERRNKMQNKPELINSKF